MALQRTSNSVRRIFAVEDEDVHLGLGVEDHFRSLNAEGLDCLYKRWRDDDLGRVEDPVCDTQVQAGYISVHCMAPGRYKAHAHASFSRSL